MIKLVTDCKDCIHAKVCRNKDNAKYAMERLKKMQYGTGPNDDYDWDIMMEHEHVTISFSCPDFIKTALPLARR